MEKKVAKKSTKVVTEAEDKKVKKAPVKAKKEQVAEPVTEVVEVKTEPAKTENVEQPKKAKTTLNQELNLMIGLLSLITIISFCFGFAGGDDGMIGWELFLQADKYSGVFKGLMILYVITIFIDCILAVRVDSENEIFNIVEKVLYMITLIMNFVVVAVLLSLIAKVGTGLLIFLIISIVSGILKLVRIYAQNK